MKVAQEPILLNFTIILKSVCRWILFQAANQHNYIKWPSPLRFFMNFTSNTTLYLGLFHTLTEKDCKIRFVWSHFHENIYSKTFGYFITLFYFKKIKLYLHFAFRGTICSKILTSWEKLWNHFYISMLFWNYNICIYGGSINSFVLPYFHVLAEKIAI